MIYAQPTTPNRVTAAQYFLAFLEGVQDSCESSQGRDLTPGEQEAKCAALAVMSEYFHGDIKDEYPQLMPAATHTSPALPPMIQQMVQRHQQQHDGE